MAKLHAIDPYASDGLVGGADRFADVGRLRLHAENAPPRRDETSVAARRAGVEDVDPRKPAVGIEPLDAKPRARRVRIAGRSENHADRRLGPPAEGGRQLPARGDGLEERQDILVEPRQNGLTLRIPEAAVELDD